MKINFQMKMDLDEVFMLLYRLGVLTQIYRAPISPEEWSAGVKLWLADVDSQ